MTNLASMFEMEDPWLPPTTWEFIPSQNAPASRSFVHPPPPSTSPHPSPDAASSVSEASLVRLALNALLGSESALLSIETLSAAFCSRPADRSHHHCRWNHRSATTLVLGNILTSFASFGSLVLLLRKFVQNFQHFDSLVNQAFAVAVGKVLEGYICSVDTLYASVAVRRGSQLPLSPSCFTTVVHSQVTLLELYLHTAELRNQIEALGNICSLYDVACSFASSSLPDLISNANSRFSNFYKGGDLLTYLYTQLQVADPAHRALLRFLFLRTCEPYFEYIRSWIFKAELSDPFEEFVVECADNLPSHLFGKAGNPLDFTMASVRGDVAVPCFLKDLLIPIVRAGQQLQVLKKLFELCNSVGSCDYIYNEFLPSLSGYLGDDVFGISPLSFDKKSLEAMGTARNNYYVKMQEKLKTLLTKLEFDYQPVLVNSNVSTILDNGGRVSNRTVSFILDDRDVNNTDSDHSGSIDGSYLLDLDSDESSDWSSVSGLEEHSDDQQLMEHPESLSDRERHLSSLKISMNNHIDSTVQKPIHSEFVNDIKSDLPEVYGQKGGFMHSFDRGMTLTQKIQPFGQGESSCSGTSNNRDADTLNTKYLPLGLPNSIFSNYKEYSFCQRFDLLDINRGNMEFLKGGLSCFSKKTSTECISIDRGLGVNQLMNGSSDSFTLQPWKANYQFNFLGANPMLRKNSSLNKPVKRSSTDYELSLPYFDFSKVEVPSMVPVEKTAANPRSKFGSHVPLYTTAYANREKAEQVCYVGDALVESERPSCPDLGLNERHHEAVVSAEFCGGSSWESQLGRFSYPGNERIDDQRESFSDIFEVPLDFVIDKCLVQEILFQYDYVSKLVIKLLEKGFDLEEHLLALRRYYFMESADWADLFIMAVWHHRWYGAEAEQRVSEIQGFLELSLQRSSCERDPNKNRLFVYRKGNGNMPLSASAMGVHSFDFLGLGYRVDWPVSIVLTPPALKTYSEIFSFLIQLKLAGFSLTDTWCSLKGIMGLISQKHHSTTYKQEVAHLKILLTTRHQVNHFVCALQQYVQSQLSHVSWCRFLHSLKYKVRDMMDLESVHMAYLSDSLRICFLSDETRTVTSIIQQILQCAFDFQYCLTSGGWESGLTDGDLLGKLSRINKSQVLAIKQKFDENLKQLHLCYLKSPKHGEFGLSCFWGYLNYNEFYSEFQK